MIEPLTTGRITSTWTPPRVETLRHPYGDGAPRRPRGRLRARLRAAALGALARFRPSERRIEEKCCA